MLDKSYFCMSRKRLNNTLHYNLTPTFAMSENLLNSVLPSNKTNFHQIPSSNIAKISNAKKKKVLHRLVRI